LKWVFGDSFPDILLSTWGFASGLFAVSAPVALIGALIDRRKVVSIVVLGTWMPALVFLLLWSGYW
jgi:hypothetical protein